MTSLAARPHQNSEPKLIQLLRERIPDDTFTRPGMTIALKPGVTAREACIEISNGFLRTTVVHSAAPDLNISLTARNTNTLGGLAKELKKYSAYYCVTPDGEMHQDHPSTDLRVVKGDLTAGGACLNHRRFSDGELRKIIHLAAQNQNVNYTSSTVPETEFIFVCQLAAADACKIMAQNAVKLRGLTSSVQDLMEMSKAYRDEWAQSVRHQKRAINVAKIKDSDTRRGDVMVGTLYRPSLRTGHQTPNATNEVPEAPCLHEPLAQDVQDDQVRITWDAVKDTDFYGMELWRDVVEDVKRSQLGNAKIADTQTQFNQPLPTTASLVFASVGASTRYGRSVLTQYGEATGQSVNTFVDGHDNDNNFQHVVSDADAPPPEPNTTYYYRLYVFDTNRLAIGSNVVRARTRNIRAKLSRDNSIPKIDPTTSPMAGGAPLTVKGTKFHAGMRVRLGDKIIEDLVIVDTETATGTVPEVFNEDITQVHIDLSITSDTGLVDLAKDVFKYTKT